LVIIVNKGEKNGDEKSSQKAGKESMQEGFKIMLC